MRISDWSSDVCSSDLFAVEMPGYSRGIGFDIGFPVIARREMREDDLLDARGGGDFADLLPGQVVFAHMFHQRRNLIGGEARIASQQFFHRSEERRVGNECVRTCRSWLSLDH